MKVLKTETITRLKRKVWSYQHLNFCYTVWYKAVSEVERGLGGHIKEHKEINVHGKRDYFI